MHLDSSICILQHCLDYIRARDLICHFLFSFQTCQSLFTAVGEGCSLGIEASGVGSWSPRGASSTGKGADTLSLEFPSPERSLLGHRDNLSPQDQDCGPDKCPQPGTDQGKTYFFGYQISFSLVLCLPT